MTLEADKKIAHGSSENSRLFPAMVSDDGPEDKHILFAGTLDRLDQGVNKISEKIIEISHNDNSLIVDKKQNEELYQAVGDDGCDRNVMQQVIEDNALGSMDHLSSNILSNNISLDNVKVMAHHFAAQMGVDLLQINQVASKIPSDFFQKQSKITLEDS